MKLISPKVRQLKGPNMYTIYTPIWHTQINTIPLLTLVFVSRSLLSLPDMGITRSAPPQNVCLLQREKEKMEVPTAPHLKGKWESVWPQGNVNQVGKGTSIDYQASKLQNKCK